MIFYGESVLVVSPQDLEVVWIGNVAIAGPDPHPDVKSVKVTLDVAQVAKLNQLYLSDNTGPHMTLSNQWSGVTYQGAATEANVRINTLPSWHTVFNYHILPNAKVLPYVLANAG